MFKRCYRGRQTLARLCNCDVANLCLVENASYAVNAVVHTLVDDHDHNSSDDDGFGGLVFSNSYKMVVEALDLKPKCFTVVVPHPFPIPADQAGEIHATMVKRVEEALVLYEGQIKLCVFAHISSMPSMIEPVEALTETCHRLGAKVLIDGAHAPGQMPVDIANIGCDYYTGNCHKWLFAPKGSAFLYDATRSVRPAVISSSRSCAYWSGHPNTQR